MLHIVPSCGSLISMYTVIRTQGVFFLRPEKTWRPIVTVALVDTAHPPYEVLLGCDGQNPNTKVPFTLYDVDESTQLAISISDRGCGPSSTVCGRTGSTRPIAHSSSSQSSTAKVNTDT